jgi:hypothetical protein
MIAAKYLVCWAVKVPFSLLFDRRKTISGDGMRFADRNGSASTGREELDLQTYRKR